MVLLFSACQENFVETNSTSNGSKILDKEVTAKFPDTYVHGYVTKNSNPYAGAKVELWKDGNLLTYTYSSKNGYYNICVCCQGVGTGYYIVKTDVYIQGDLWSSSALFYFNTETGPFDFNIDLPLAYTTEKISD